MYKIVRAILFLFPPEPVHYFSMNCLKFLCNIGFSGLIRNSFTPRSKKTLPLKLLNLDFKNPVGLGAGFDKNAKWLRELECLGFGFVEIGTVTPLPQAGNDKPRLFRLPKDKGLINRMGFNNDGVQTIAIRLKKWRERLQPELDNVNAIIERQKTHITDDNLTTSEARLIVGGNIGKNKNTPNEDAWKDYEICFLALQPFVDYFVVNVSSPNTPGLRELQEKESLRKILTHLQELNKSFPALKPILLKISPDLCKEQLDDVIDLASEINLDGLVISNTTVRRDQLKTTNHKLQTIGAGGLSGLPLNKTNTVFVDYISKKTNGRIPIIASGGIFTANEAKEKLKAGATLVQVWTGFIYEGPSIVKRICKSL